MSAEMDRLRAINIEASNAVKNLVREIRGGRPNHRTIIRDLLRYVRELEEQVDSADEQGAYEGGGHSGSEWDKRSEHYLPLEERIEGRREEEWQAIMKSARDYLGDAV